MELHENHQQGQGGVEFESSEEAAAARDAERVQEGIDDPTVLANPTELQQGGVSGGDPSNTRGGDPGPATGADLPGNAGDATGPVGGNAEPGSNVTTQVD